MPDQQTEQPNGLLELRKNHPDLHGLLQRMVDLDADAFKCVCEKRVWTADLIDGFEAAYAEISSPRSTLSLDTPLIGGIAFFLLIFEIEKPKEERDQARILALASRKETQAFILEFYQITHRPLGSTPSIESFEFLENGTTSLIFSAIAPPSGPWPDHIVFKLIKPMYWSNQRVIEATKQVEERHKGLSDYCPQIFEVDAIHGRWIVMKRIRGLTLRQYGDKFLRPDPTGAGTLSSRQIERVREVLQLLCGTLAHCANARKTHDDLSPHNILVEHTDGKVDKLYLIDLGRNFVVLDQTFFSADRAGVELFIAPEYRRRFAIHMAPSQLADFYSLGLIALELLNRRPLEPTRLLDSMSQLWQSLPGVAQLVDDLTENDPELRLSQSQAGRTDWESQEERYHFLRRAFHAELDLYRATLVDEEEARYSRQWLELRPILEAIFSIHTRTRLRAAVKFINENELDKHWARAKRMMALAPYAYGSIYCLFVVFAAFILTTWLDVKVARGFTFSFGLDEVLLSALRSPIAADWVQYTPGEDIATNLVRRVTVLFSASASARYYLNICTLLECPPLRSDRHSFKLGGSTLTRLTNALTRLNSVWFVLPSLIVIVAAPRWWPWLTATGYFLTAANLWLIAALVRHSLKWVNWSDDADRSSDGMKISRPSSDETREFQQAFNTWWMLIGLIGIILITVQVLMQLQLAQDEMIYAVLYCLAVTPMLIWNCGSMAPYIRGGLERVFFVLHRADHAGALRIRPQTSV